MKVNQLLHRYTGRAVIILDDSSSITLYSIAEITVYPDSFKYKPADLKAVREEYDRVSSRQVACLSVNSESLLITIEEE